jgi:hypothetical protein
MYGQQLPAGPGGSTGRLVGQIPTVGTIQTAAMPGYAPGMSYLQQQQQQQQQQQHAAQMDERVRRYSGPGLQAAPGHQHLQDVRQLLAARNSGGMSMPQMQSQVAINDASHLIGELQQPFSHLSVSQSMLDGSHDLSQVFHVLYPSTTHEYQQQHQMQEHYQMQQQHQHLPYHLPNGRHSVSALGFKLSSKRRRCVLSDAASKCVTGF